VQAKRQEGRKQNNGHARNDFGEVFNVAEGYGGLFVAHEKGHDDDDRETEEDVRVGSLKCEGRKDQCPDQHDECYCNKSEPKLSHMNQC
jgi:hypothetical protein